MKISPALAISTFFASVLVSSCEPKKGSASYHPLYLRALGYYKELRLLPDSSLYTVKKFVIQNDKYLRYDEVDMNHYRIYLRTDSKDSLLYFFNQKGIYELDYKRIYP
jgi:hypothetical protein